MDEMAMGASKQVVGIVSISRSQYVCVQSWRVVFKYSANMRNINVKLLSLNLRSTPARFGTFIFYANLAEYQ